MKLEELKTLGQMLQEIVNKDYYSLHEFLLDSTEGYRKETEYKLVDMDYKQYYKYMDSLKFENREQLETEICKYLEYVNQQDIGMWEMMDISDMADEYIEYMWFPFNDDED